MFFLSVYCNVPRFPFLLCFQLYVGGKLDFGFLCVRCALSPFLPLVLTLNNLTIISFSFVLLIFLVLKGHWTPCISDCSLYHIWENLACHLALTVWETESRTGCLLYKCSIPELHTSTPHTCLPFVPLLSFKDFSYVHNRPLEVPSFNGALLIPPLCSPHFSFGEFLLFMSSGSVILPCS